MKIKMDIELTPDEARDLFVPSDKQHEFMVKTYDAYVKALQDMVWDQVDPYQMIRKKDDD